MSNQLTKEPNLKPVLQKWLIICLLSFGAIPGFSQTQEAPLPFKVLGGLGVAGYHGDICPGLSCIQPRPGSSIGIRYFMNKHFSFRPELYYYRIQGEDAKGPNPTRNLSFRSTNLSLTLNLVYDFIELNPRPEYRAPFSPYVLAGVGGLFFNPQAELKGKWIELQPLGTEGEAYSRFVPLVALGFGARFKINKRMDLLVEYNFQLPFSDYLDDVSGEYVDNRTLPETTQLLADRTYELGIAPEESDDGVHWREGASRGNGFPVDGVSLFLVKWSIAMFPKAVALPGN